MSNFPNMSYCMCENTLNAVQQISNAIDDAGSIAEFRDNLSDAERRAFMELIWSMRDIIGSAEYQGII